MDQELDPRTNRQIEKCFQGEESDLDFTGFATVAGHCRALPFFRGDSSAFGVLLERVCGARGRGHTPVIVWGSGRWMSFKRRLKVRGL